MTLAVWGTLNVVSIAGYLVTKRRTQNNERWASALWFSMLATLPGTLLSMEFLLVGVVRDKNLPFEPFNFRTLLPATLGALVLSFWLLKSYLQVPPSRWPFQLEIARTLHLVTWAWSWLVILESFVSV